MTKIKALTFKQKQETLKKLFDQYHRAKLKLYCLEMTDFYPVLNYDMVRDKKRSYQSGTMVSKLNKHIDDKDELKNVILSFDHIIDSLSSDSKLIIEKEFIEKVKHDWWREFFAKSTYYRMKSKAMEEVLFYLNV